MTGKTAEIQKFAVMPCGNKPRDCHLVSLQRQMTMDYMRTDRIKIIV